MVNGLPINISVFCHCILEFYHNFPKFQQNFLEFQGRDPEKYPPFPEKRERRVKNKEIIVKIQGRKGEIYRVQW